MFWWYTNPLNRLCPKFWVPDLLEISWGIEPRREARYISDLEDIGKCKMATSTAKGSKAPSYDQGSHCRLIILTVVKACLSYKINGGLYPGALGLLRPGTRAASKGVLLGNITVGSRNEGPRSEMVSLDVQSDHVPYLREIPVTC